MADLNPAIPITTLNMNGLNITINRQRLSDLILKRSNITYMLSTRYSLVQRNK